MMIPVSYTHLIAENDNTSKDTVKRYIRLTNLIPPILDMVDEKRIAFTPAVELSYLLPEEQIMLLSEMEYSDCTPNLSQAQRLKAVSYTHLDVYKRQIDPPSIQVFQIRHRI